MIRGTTYTAVRRVQRVYWRVARPRTRGVRAIVIDDAGRVLLVRHSYAMDRSGSTWYLPGGGVRRKETFEQAIVRELDEEVGIEPDGPLKWFGEYTNTVEGKRDRVVVFVLRRWTGEPASSHEVDSVTFAGPAAPPDGTSPATRRRLAELTGAADTTSTW